MASIVGASRLAAILTLDIKPFIRGTELASTKLEAFRQRAQALGSTLGRSLGVALGLVSAAALRAAAEFNKIESQLRAVGTGQNIEGIVDKAKQLGIETMFTATEVLQLGLELKKLGFDAESTAQAMETSTKLTQVFGGSLTQVGTSVAEAQRQFRSASGEFRSFAEIGDIFATAFASSALDSTKLAGALKNVGSVAGVANYSIEETVALLALLADAGQKSGLAGTRLKTALLELGEEFGFTGRELTALTSGNLDIAETFEILNKRAGVAGAVIGKMGLEFYELQVRLEDSVGALDAMNDGLENQLFIQLEKNTNALQSMGRVLGDSLAPYVTAMAATLGDLATSFENADPATKALIGRFTVLGVLLPVVAAGAAALAGALSFLIAHPLVFALTALTSLFVDFQLEQAKTKTQLDQVGESLASFQELLVQTDGDLLNLSLPVLQKELENTKKAIQDAELAQKKVLFNERGQRLSDEEAFLEVYKSQVGFVDKLYRTQERTDELRAQAAEELQRIKDSDVKLQEQLLALQNAIAEKEAALKKEAERRFELAQKTGDTLLEQREALGRILEDGDKIKETFTKAFAVFGEANNDILGVRDAIKSINLALPEEIITEGIESIVGNFDELLKGGTLESNITLVDTLAKAFRDLAIESASLDLANTAAQLDQFAAEFEAKLKAFQFNKKLREAIEGRTEGDAVSRKLFNLDQIGFGEQLNNQIGNAKKLLTDLLTLGYDTTSQRVKDLVVEIEGLLFVLSSFNAQQELDKIFATAKRKTAGEVFTINKLAADIGDVKISDTLSGELKRLETQYLALFDLLNPADPEQLPPGSQEQLDEVFNKWKTLFDRLNKQLSLEEFEQSLKALDQQDALRKINVELGLLDEAGARSQQIQTLAQRIRLLKEAPEGADTAALEAYVQQLKALLQIEEDFKNAQTVVSFFREQISFLGDAFLQATQSGENFFDTLKKSFLSMFQALVAKLITLIALFAILRIVATGGTGGISGAAAAATTDGIGSFLISNLVGVKSLQAASVGGGKPLGIGEAGNVKVMGAVSGNNLVIMNQRGKRAYDRTFG